MSVVVVRGLPWRLAAVPFERRRKSATKLYASKGSPRVLKIDNNASAGILFALAQNAHNMIHTTHLSQSSLQTVTDAGKIVNAIKASNENNKMKKSTQKMLDRKASSEIECL